MRLAGRNALITGGGSGIGLACAAALAAEGCRVAVCGRDEATLRRAAEGFPAPGLLHQRGDVADRASVAALFAWAARELGPLHILINAAGINVPRRMMDNLAPEDWDLLLQVNATGAYNCIRAVLPQMRERRAGLIVNVSSVSGKRASPLGGVGYNASKFAMSALGISVGEEFREEGVRVSNIYPGEVDTPILRHRPVAPTPAQRARMLQPADVAAAVLMIACLPERASVPELVITPARQGYI